MLRKLALTSKAVLISIIFANWQIMKGEIYKKSNALPWLKLAKAHEVAA